MQMMKETLLQWLSPVLENRYIQIVVQDDFLCGVIAGILLMILLRILVWVIFRRRSCQAINVTSDFGTVTIGVNAIFSVIKHSCSSIKCLAFSKLEIFPKKNMYNFHLRAVMDAEQGADAKLMETISLIIRKEMTAVFGMDNIGEIKLFITGCKSLEEEENAGEDENDFQDFIEQSDKSDSAGSGRIVSLRHNK
jgi:hypothetical protein